MGQALEHQSCFQLTKYKYDTGSHHLYGSIEKSTGRNQDQCQLQERLQIVCSVWIANFLAKLSQPLQARQLTIEK